MKKEIILLLLVTILGIFLTSCEYEYKTTPNISIPTLPIMETSNISGEEVNVSLNITNTGGVAIVEGEENISEILTTINAVEGDLIRLNIRAYDPDNDTVTIYYGEPFNEQGLWQTKIGDAGKYLVRIIASDGKTNTTGYVRVIIARANRPPVINCPDKITVKEGEDFNLKCEFYDEDNDELVVTYSGWMTSNHKKIGYDEAGTHEVLVTASDGKHRVTKLVVVEVENVNREPILGVSDIEAMEGDIVVLNYNVSDPDGDKVQVSFSEPFNDQGVWQTSIGDAGVYTVTVIASDGEAVVERKVNVTIKMRNTPPIIKAPDTVEAYEGETLRLPVEYYDREDKALIVTVSGWMESLTKELGYEDAGTHTVTITVSDGQYTTSKSITIIVHDVNRPPVFIRP